MSYSSIEQFLEQQYPALCAILERAATAAGGHYAEMTPEARRHNAENDAVELISALAQGYVDPDVVRATGARPTTGGLIADDLLRLANYVEPRIEELAVRELARQPDLRDELLARKRRIYARFRAALTSARIDQVLTRLNHPQKKV
jgi:hypothetical protein